MADWADESIKDAAFAVAQLRHLYAQMLDGRVVDVRQAAKGLLGPSIERLERLATAADLRAAYERGVRAAAGLCAQDAARCQRLAERHQEDEGKAHEATVSRYRAERLSDRILALIDKE